MKPDIASRIVMIGLLVAAVLIIYFGYVWLTGSPPDTAGNDVG